MGFSYVVLFQYFFVQVAIANRKHLQWMRRFADKQYNSQVGIEVIQNTTTSSNSAGDAEHKINSATIVSAAQQDEEEVTSEAKMIESAVDNIARVVFPIPFILFNLIFWLYYNR